MDADLAQKEGLAFCFDGGVGNDSVFYIDNFKIEEYFVSNVLENGDAEAGTDNWTYFANGTVASVDGGANNTSKAIKYTPENKYGSVNYGIGGFILKGGIFNGNGAGKYTISFYAKAEAGKGGKFLAALCTDPYHGVDAVKDALGEGNGDSMQIIDTIELTDQWQKFEWTVDFTDYIEKLDQLQEKGLSVNNIFIRLDGATQAFNTETFSYFVDEMTVAKYVAPSATATATATPTPTPIPNKVVSNGDAENGDTNWSSIHAGSVQITADPDDANNKVAYFTPTEGNQYSSVAFDLGPAIIKNAAEGYNGGGAGTYIITFRARAEEGFDGTFSVLLNSMAHKNKGAVVKVNGNDVTLESNTYATGSSITMIDEWEEFTATVEITEEMLESIEAIKNSSDGAATKAYVIAFRLDGSGSRAFGSEQFCYYVDDIAIEKEGGDEEETEKAPTGIEYEAKTDIESSSLYFVGKKGAFSMADVKDGELTVKFQVKNSGEEAMGIIFELQALVGGKWVGPAKGELVTIDPGKTEWVEYTCEVSDDGKVEISGEDVAISELFIRFDLADGDGGTEVLKGAKFIVYASGAQYDALKAVTTRPGWGSATVYSAPAGTGDALPVALVAVLVAATAAFVVVAKKRKED